MGIYDERDLHSVEFGGMTLVQTTGGPVMSITVSITVSAAGGKSSAGPSLTASIGIPYEPGLTLQQLRIQALDRACDLLARMSMESRGSLSTAYEASLDPIRFDLE